MIQHRCYSGRVNLRAAAGRQLYDGWVPELPRVVGYRQVSSTGSNTTVHHAQLLGPMQHSKLRLCVDMPPVCYGLAQQATRSKGRQARVQTFQGSFQWKS